MSYNRHIYESIQVCHGVILIKRLLLLIKINSPFIFAAISLLGSITLVTLLIAGSHIREKSEKTLNLIEKNYGTEIKIRKRELRFSNAYLEDININSSIKVAASKIKISFNTNPLKKNIGTLNGIEIANIRIKTPINDLKDILISKAYKKNSTKNHNSKSKHFFSIPESIQINHGELILTDANNTPLLQFRNLKSQYKLDQNIINFEVNGLFFKDEKIFNNIKGQIVLNKNRDHFPIVITNSNDGESWQTYGKIKKDLSSIKLFLKNKGIAKKLLPKFLTNNINLDTLAYATSLKISLDKERNNIAFALNTATSNLKIQHPTLSKDPIGPIPLLVKIRGKFNPKSKTLEINKGLLKIRPTNNKFKKNALTLKFNLKKIDLSNEKDRIWKISATLPKTPCKNIIRSAPRNLIPRIQSFKLNGDMGFKIHIEAPEREFADFRYRIEKSYFNCGTISTAYEFSQSRLNSQNPIKNYILSHDFEKKQLKVHPNDYVPFEKISKHLTKAFITSEDGGFYHHKGIEFQSLINALRKNLKEKKIVVGGSTITMQTVKNLFLTHDRTLKRKLQEMFLTWHLEKSLSKNKILEIYANIIEFGPNIFGIKKASNHFFAKDPSKLSVSESAYLAAILPSPLKRYSYFCNNSLTNNIYKTIDKNIQKMSEMRFITKDELNKALTEKIIFSKKTQQQEFTQTCLKRSFSRSPKSHTIKNIEF